MSDNALVIQVDITAKDKPGLVHEISDVLFGAGANLADTSFVVLGAACRLTCLAEFSHVISKDDLLAALKACRAAEGADIRLTDFPFDNSPASNAVITHRLFISGGDRPGLVQRISEVIVQHGANIVRLNAHRTETAEGFTYVTRFALHVPADGLASLDNAIANTAGTMRLQAELVEA